MPTCRIDTELERTGESFGTLLRRCLWRVKARKRRFSRLTPEDHLCYPSLAASPSNLLLRIKPSEQQQSLPQLTCRFKILTEQGTCLIKAMSAVQSILYPAGGIILIQSNIKNVGNSASGYPYSKVSHLHASASCKFLQDKLHPRLIYNMSKNKRSASVLVFGKKGDFTSDSEELLKKAEGNFRRELTVQDLLREYTKKKQSSGNGGGGGNSFRGGGDGSGGLEGKGFSAQYEELLQVILAAIGVIFLYVLITKGEELTLLCRDYINYLLGSKASARLIRTMEKWRR